MTKLMTAQQAKDNLNDILNDEKIKKEEKESYEKYVKDLNDEIIRVSKTKRYLILDYIGTVREIRLVPLDKNSNTPTRAYSALIINTLKENGFVVELVDPSLETYSGSIKVSW